MIKWSIQTIYSEMKYISFDILEGHYKLWKYSHCKAITEYLMVWERK